MTQRGNVTNLAALAGFGDSYIQEGDEVFVLSEDTPYYYRASTNLSVDGQTAVKANYLGGFWLRSGAASVVASGGDIVSIGNLASGGSIGPAASTVDISGNIDIAQTTPGQTLSLPTPTDQSVSHTVNVANTGTQSFTMLGTVVAAGSGIVASWTGGAWQTV